jgi:ribA/ribD-fused uncharacterized protein
MHPRSTADLRRRVLDGWSPEYFLFLEPEPAQPGVLGPECLSQWYASEMIVDGVRFPTAEHYMMWRKARAFGDVEIEQQLLADDSPAVAKQLGRRVRNYRSDVWDRMRFDVVVEGSIAKYQQNATLRRYLLETGDGVLAEASPVDDIWGIGFAAGNPFARDPQRWTGLNLLGFALMDARAKFSR